MLASLALASGVVPADEPGRLAADDTSSDEATERVCFNNRQVRNFDGLSDRYVYLEASGGKNYLLAMRSPCNGLRNAYGIAIRDATSRVCDNSFAEIIYKDLGRLQRCRIGTIERVENKEEAKAVVAEREADEKRQRKSKKEKQADN
jgi:hypothetical protein